MRKKISVNLCRAVFGCRSTGSRIWRGALFFLGGLLFLSEFNTDRFFLSMIYFCVTFGIFGIAAGVVLELLLAPYRSILQVSSYAVLYVPLTPLDHLASILVVLCLSVSLSRLVMVVQRRRILRPILLGNLLLQLFFLFLASRTDLPVEQTIPGCDYTLASPAQIRVENIFIEYEGEPHSETRFFASQDKGQSWKQFATLSHDAVYCGTEGAYSSAGSSGDDSVWVWHRGLLMVSHDAGRNWHYWSFASSLDEEFRATLSGTPERYLIMNVTFESETSGTMLVMNLDAPPDNQDLNLTTEDGGIIWQPLYPIK